MLVCAWVAEQGGVGGLVNKDLFCYRKRRLLLSVDCLSEVRFSSSSYRQILSFPRNL